MLNKAVACFDLDGVIIFHKEFFGEYLTSKNPKIEKQLNTFFTNIYPDCQVGKKDLKNELGQLLQDISWAGTVDSFLQKWFQIECRRIDKKVLEKVSALRSAGHKCIITSDQEKYRGEYLFQRVRSSFDDHFFSYELGYLKKDIGYWKKLLPQINVKAGDLIYWDDNKENIKTAQKIGIDARLFSESEIFFKQADAIK